MEEKSLRFGITTGSCAAAAAKAATYMLLSGDIIDHIVLHTPKGIQISPAICKCIREGRSTFSCAVQKDAGDDPDITDGIYVYARVSILDKNMPDGLTIELTGGEGIGIVTKPGLDQPVGEYAINHGPRVQIKRAVADECAAFDFNGRIRVEISAPQGVELAQKTFNPRLGIVGGISILGTSGIVEPMSEEALLATILVEIGQKKALGKEILLVAPGNYGQDFLKRAYGFNVEDGVKCSNFIEKSLQFAQNSGFRKVLFTGHLGKLIKVAAGVGNTHSRYGDGRMETILMLCRDMKLSEESRQKIAESVVVDDALSYLEKDNIITDVMNKAAARIKTQMEFWTKNKVQVEVVLFSNVYGKLAETKGAKAFIDALLAEREK